MLLALLFFFWTVGLGKLFDLVGECFELILKTFVIPWVVPPPSNSHHHDYDYYIFSRGSL